MATLAEPIESRTATALPRDKTPLARVASIDAYRGLVMLLMMAEVLEFSEMSSRIPASGFWRILGLAQTHVAWVGCSLHDLIQPSFSFLVGVALPFSIARRAGEGQPQWRRTVHAFWRALILILLGVFLRSMNHRQTYWTFEDTLTQIGLGYGFLYLLALRSVASSMDCLRYHSVWLLARVRTVIRCRERNSIGAMPESRQIGRITSLALPHTGIITPTPPGPSTPGSSICSQPNIRSRITQAAIAR